MLWKKYLRENKNKKKLYYFLFCDTQHSTRVLFSTRRNNMELKLDKTTKILLGTIAFGLFLNASNVFIDKAHANDWDLVVELNKSNVKIDRMQENLNIIDKNVRVLEKIIDTAENNLTAAINNACK